MIRILKTLSKWLQIQPTDFLGLVVVVVVVVIAIIVIVIVILLLLLFNIYLFFNPFY